MCDQESESEDSFHYYEDDSSSDEVNENCKMWDYDCKVVSVHYDGDSFTGTSSVELNEKITGPPLKKLKRGVEINNRFTKDKFLNEFKNHWTQNKHFLSNEAELISEPFKVGILKNFIHDKDFLDNIREEFNEIEWHKRNMDLYEFFQSSDLKHLENFEFISKFYKFLEDNVMKWISIITGTDLNKVSATCSLYGDTDYLLVHDDQQEDRMIAFILYLTDIEWKESYGGSLQLFNKNENDQPHKAVRNIFPENNQFVFFQVSRDSYHQVSEVTCKNDCRLSINGWFHSKIPQIFETPTYLPPVKGIFSNQFINPIETDIDLSDWISEEYLSSETAEEIQAYIEENSEISLHGYFKHLVIHTVLEDLKSDGVKWIQVGPPNRYCYSILEENNLPQTIERLLLLFQSEHMFRLLKEYTDLDLNFLKYEMQKWTPGNYSLLSDYNWSEKNELDLILYLGCSDPKSVVGGKTMYVAVEDEIQQAFITVEPQENNLNIIYRDTARFTKYFSKQSTCECFYMLICSYSE